MHLCMPMQSDVSKSINCFTTKHNVPFCFLEHFVGAKETECKDSITGVSYHSGESWNRNDCVHCICFEGETSCMTSVCAKPICEQPIKRNGVCCPVCSEDEQGTCRKYFTPNIDTN